MSEMGSSSAIETTDIPEPLPDAVQSVGQQLGNARAARGMSVSDVAQALKLSTRQVEALEADDWVSLPCNTIVRGFVRNYARLLGLNTVELMSALDRLEMALVPELDIPAGTNVRVPQEGQVQRRDYFSVLAGLVVLLLAVLAYFFLPPALWDSALSALKSATQSKETLSKKAVTSSSGGEASVAVVVPPQTGVAADSPSTPIQSLPAPVPASVPATALINSAASENALKFSFTQPSWVEVRDRSGEVVFSQLCQAGSQQEVEGQPPFSLVIGNASNVTLHYKGKPVDLSKRSKDDVARVSVE